MYEIEAYSQKNHVKIEQLPIQRDWMENMKNSYKCFPMGITNRLGWGFSFPEDISFIWDGETENFSKHVKILSGSKYITINDSNKTLSFITGTQLKTNENITILIMPVPNQFIDGIQNFTALISTSFFNEPLQIPVKIIKSNQVITIKSGTPVGAIIPLELKLINNSVIKIFKFNKRKISFENSEYGKEQVKIWKNGKWAFFYRYGTDHKGNKIGKHDLKVLKFNVKHED